MRTKTPSGMQRIHEYKERQRKLEQAKRVAQRVRYVSPNISKLKSLAKEFIAQLTLGYEEFRNEMLDEGASTSFVTPRTFFNLFVSSETLPKDNGLLRQLAILLVNRHSDVLLSFSAMHNYPVYQAMTLMMSNPRLVCWNKPKTILRRYNKLKAS